MQGEDHPLHPVPRVSFPRWVQGSRYAPLALRSTPGVTGRRAGACAHALERPVLLKNHAIKITREIDVTDLNEALRGLSVESAVLADLARLQTDEPHRAAVRKLLWQRIEEINGRLGYCCRPWYKALEILDELHTTPRSRRPTTDDDTLIALKAKDRIGHFRDLASLDPEAWWHSEELWQKFCAYRKWVPEDHL